MRITTFLIISIVVLLHIANSFAQYPPKPWPTYSLENMPRTGFSCQAKILGGYYADAETQCQMFHVCVKVAGVGVKDFRFLCPNGTAFDQEAQICADWGDVDCEQSTLYYSSDNFDLYRLGSGFESKRAPVIEDEQPFHLQNAESNDLRRTPQQNTNSQSFNRNNAGNYNEDSTSFSKKPNYSNLRKVPTIRTTSTTTTTESSYYADRRGDEEIFKGSHSSNFFNNRNNGKEEDLVDFPTKPQQPRIQNHRGRHRPQNSFRNSLSNNNNNIQPFPTKASDVPALQTTLSTSTTTTYAPPTTARANFGSNDASQPQTNIKTISLQSSFRASDSSSVFDNSQRLFSSTTDIPSFQRNAQQQTDAFFKPTSQQNIQPTTYSPSYKPFSYDSSSPSSGDFRGYEKTSSTPTQTFKQPPQNSFYNAQFENRATESYDQLRNQDLPDQGVSSVDTSSTSAPVFDVVRTVPKTNSRINARPTSFGEARNNYNEGQNYFNERQNAFNQRQKSNDGANFYDNTRQNNLSERPSSYAERTISDTEKQNSFVDRSSSYNERQNTYIQRQSAFNERQNSFNGRQNSVSERQNERKAFNDQQNQQVSNRNPVQQTTSEYPQPPPKPQRSRRPTQYRGSQHFNKQALLDETEVSSPLNVKPLEIQTQPSSTTESSRKTEQNQFNGFTKNFRPTVRPIQSSTPSTYSTPNNYNVANAFGFSDNSRASPSPFASPPEQSELGLQSNKQNDRFAQNNFEPLPTYNETPRGFSLNPPFEKPNIQSRQTTTTPKSSFSKKIDEQPYDNFTPSTQAKKFSTLVPRDQFYPTTFKPATYKKLIQGYDAKIGTSTKFAASSYLPTSTTTTLRPQPADSQIDEDDGQYHPELYEKDFIRSKVKTRKEEYSERTIDRRPTEPPTDAEDDEFLNTAHSLNIAAGANRLRAEKNKQSSPTINRPAPTSTAAIATSTRKSVSAPKSQHHSTSAKKNSKPQNEDASYDYAYYDSFGGNPQDYDYELNLEFGKTRKN